MKKQTNSKEGKSLRLYPLVLTAAALVAVFCVLLSYESDYLFRSQELNLFLYTPLFFQQKLVVAGGLLSYLGTYFTQFFYHPWLGTLLLCLWLALLTWLVKVTFRIPDQWAPLMLIPAALLLIIDFDLGYWIYYIKLTGHLYVAVIGTTLAVSLVLAYRWLAAKKMWAGLVWMGVAAVVAYPMAGVYGLVAIVLMGAISWRLTATLQQRIGATALAAILVVAIPLICYRQVYYQANSDNIWFQALPVFKLQEDFSTLYYPYILLALCLLVMAVCYRPANQPKPVAKPLLWGAAQLGLLAIIGFGTYQLWYKDKAFHEEISMTLCVDRQDWAGTIDLVRKHEGEPTRMMVMYKTLALFKMGRAADEMYNYPDGSLTPDCPFQLRFAQVGGKNIYLFYGLPNYCYRWCLEDGVENGWRVEYLKFLTRCALLNGEHEVARKYIDLLKQTRYYGEWAESYEPLLNDPDGKRLAAHAELGPIRQLMEGVDQLGSDQSLIELFMLNSQAYRITSDPKVAELVLLSAMQLKDISTFWRAFFQYANLHVGKPMPRHFQEAAYLYGHLEDKVDISHMPFDPAVVKSYNGFMQLAQQCKNAGMNEERMKVMFRPQYGHTFFYNYFLMRNMKSY